MNVLKNTTLVFFFLMGFYLLWNKGAPDNSYSEKVIIGINAKFQNELTIFDEQAQRFNTVVLEAQPNKTNETGTIIVKSYKNLRKSFKKVEFLMEYLDKESFNFSINGAPLPKIEKKVPDVIVLDPKGLQVIDELLAEPLHTESLKELQYYSDKLSKDVTRIRKYLKNKTITDRQFFEASRISLIRLTSLGVTGFDTPGTLEGIADAEVVIKSLHSYIAPYRLELKNIGKLTLAKECDAILKAGEKQLKHTTFDNFDRLTFIREVVNPLYKIIRDIHLALNYETIDEVTKYTPATNYMADNLFGKDFLDPFYYVSLEQDKNYKDKENLGQKLFNDTRLSQNGTMACASCHKKELAFTDGEAITLSNDGSPLKRNSMTLNYSVFAKGYFHDLRTHRLEDQFEHVIVSKGEFNSSYKEIIIKLNAIDEYKDAFAKAFPEDKEPISRRNLDYAFTAYTMGLNSYTNKFDRYFNGEPVTLTKKEKEGFNLFTGKAACATCHFLPLYNGSVPPFYLESESEVLGVPETTDDPTQIDDDLGRIANGRPKDGALHYKNSFKTPTLRNIALTAPYMHNGVFATLEEVMDFYNKGGGAGQGMNISHQTLAPDPLELTNEEIDAIIDFMEALTDEEFKPFIKTITETN
ncbi:cytochrome c peroxidase [uncultured Dokdonia sp.]|uniref:cytochrome-c peroxidase n=1 Tax=uncultured Dokdonia sp. TaxID=575653 RepID=UPI00261A4450|nr:cytochrome c peroxidase [uncultured Dokdonia sp.]